MSLLGLVGPSVMTGASPEPSTTLALATPSRPPAKTHTLSAWSLALNWSLMAAGLVDEYRLFVHPAVQGRGRRLFPDGHVIPRLRLLDARSFARTWLQVATQASAEIDPMLDALQTESAAWVSPRTFPPSRCSTT